MRKFRPWLRFYKYKNDREIIQSREHLSVAIRMNLATVSHIIFLRQIND